MQARVKVLLSNQGLDKDVLLDAWRYNRDAEALHTQVKVSKWFTTYEH